MPDETEVQEVIEEPKEEQAEPSAETKKTEKKAEPMLPKSRFDEVNTKLHDAEKELEKFRKADEDRKKSEMTEIERLKLEKQEADQRAEKASDEAKELRFQKDFDDTADELDIKFANRKAKEDAYKFLDREIVGDGSGMKKALEALQDERPYLFAKEEAEQPATDARQKGTHSKDGSLTADKKEELKQRMRLRNPR